MLIDLEKIAASPSVVFTQKEMHSLLGVMGIAGVMALMRYAGKQSQMDARREEALLRSELGEAELARQSRRHELGKARGLTAQHLRLSLMDRGIFTGGDDPSSAPYIMAAARRNAMGPDYLPTKRQMAHAMDDKVR